jgi:fatty acid desaturase
MTADGHSATRTTSRRAARRRRAAAIAIVICIGVTGMLASAGAAIGPWEFALLLVAAVVAGALVTRPRRSDKS